MADAYPTLLLRTCSVLCLAALAVLVLLGTPAVTQIAVATPQGDLETAVVRGSITENAAVIESVAGASVTIAGVAAVVQDQSYEVSGIPVGQQTLVVTAPGHPKLEKTVELVAGENVVDVVLDLTARTTYLRYFHAYSTGHLRTAWKMMHPDLLDRLDFRKKPFTFKRWAAFMTNRIHYRTVRIVKIRTHETWKPHFPRNGLRRGYADVKCVTTRFFWREDGRDLTQLCCSPSHWQQISGRWYVLFTHPFYGL